MKTGVVVTLLALALSATASPDGAVGTLFPRVLSCTTGDVACNDVTKGALGVTDCTLGDGTYVDSHQLAGTANQLVAVTVRPLSPTYRGPTISIAPPAGDASKTPMSSGGAAGTVWFNLTSSGDWKIEVGSTDLFSSGAYALETNCRPRERSGQCFEPEILCGQTQRWDLTSQSCRFGSKPARLFQYYTFYGVAGDVIEIEMVSDSFAPRFGINDYSQGTLLQASVAVGSDTARMTYMVPASSLYWIVASSTEDREVGPYSLTVNCAKSGCLHPLVLSQPREVEVAYGESATLKLDVHHVGPVEYRWHEFIDYPRVVATTATAQWRTGPITTDHLYYLTASSPCGYRDSDPIHVFPSATSRRRAVGK